MNSDKKLKNTDGVGVYLLHNPNTEEVYVGSGDLATRKSKHFRDLENGKQGRVNYDNKAMRHHNRNLQQAYNLDSNFQFVGISMIERDAAYQVEQAIIDKFKGDPRLLNIALDATGGGRAMSDETREKISKSRKEYYQRHPEAVEEIRQRNLGNKASDETRKKQSDAQKRHYENNPERREQIKVNLSNRVITEETRKKLSKIHSGKIVSEETRDKLRTARANQVITPEAREAMSRAGKGRIKTAEHRANISNALKRHHNS